MGGVGFVEAAEQFGVCVDALLLADRTGEASVEFAAAMDRFEADRRRLESVDQANIFEVTERGVGGEFGRTSPVDFLVDLLRISPAEARARVNRARDLGPRRAYTGERLEPILPVVSAAVRAGEISADHAREVIRAVDRIPDRYAARFSGLVEDALVTQARLTHPGEVAKAGQVLLARIDQDGEEPRDEERERRRDFDVGRRPDGTRVPRGTWTPVAGAIWDSILDKLAAPIPGPDGEPDPRTAGQRRHDAMIEAGLRLIRSGALPDCGGTPLTLLAHVNVDDLTAQFLAEAQRHGIDLSELTRHPDHGDDSDDGDGEREDDEPTDDEPTDDSEPADDDIVDEPTDDEPTDDSEPIENEPTDNDDDAVDASGEVIAVSAVNRAERRAARRAARRKLFQRGMVRTAHGDLISLSDLLRLASEAEIIPVVLTSAGGILAYGRTRRLASPAQRRALAARDRGCCFPGCSRPPAWCQAHHVISWLLDGPTDLDNLCLLCSYHHREFERRGWTVHMRNGAPEWIPPPWLDPDQTPRRNTAHHLTDLDFAYDYDDTG